MGEEKELYSKQLNAIDVNWMIKDKLKEKIQVSAKTRYSTKESKAIIYPIENGKMKVEFITCGSVDDGKSTLIGHILYDSKLLYADQEKAL